MQFFTWKKHLVPKQDTRVAETREKLKSYQIAKLVLVCFPWFKLLQKSKDLQKFNSFDVGILQKSNHFVVGILQKFNSFLVDSLLKFNSILVTLVTKSFYRICR